MYTLDTKAAKQADQSGNRLTEMGKYVGKFIQAENHIAKTGTKGIALRFDVDGQFADLKIYTLNGNGDQIMGYKTLMAIMTCLQLRNITPKEGAVTAWDNIQKKEIQKPAIVFPELCSKNIGLLLETEEFQKDDGSIGKKLVISGVFQAGTELTASEILDRKTSPELLWQMVARMKNRPLRGSKAYAAPARQAEASAAQSGGGFDDLDDDVPF